MRRGMDPPEDPPAARSYGGSITGPEGEIYLSPETVEEQEYRNARAPIDVVTTRGLEVEPSMISLDADLCRMSMTHLGAGTNSTQDPDVVVPPVRGLTSAISLVLHEPPAMDGSSPSGSYVDAPVVYQEPSCGGNASVASMRSSLSAIDAPTDAPDTTENNPTPVSVQNSIPNTSQRPSRGPGVNMRDPSMISICEDLPFQYDMQLPTTSLQEEQATQPTTGTTTSTSPGSNKPRPKFVPNNEVSVDSWGMMQALQPTTGTTTSTSPGSNKPRPKFVPNNEVSVDSWGMMQALQPDKPLTRDAYNKQRPKFVANNEVSVDSFGMMQALQPDKPITRDAYNKSYHSSKNEVSVDSFGMMQGMQGEISVDGFINAHQHEWKPEAPKRDIITNQVNADSVIGQQPRTLDKWRTHAASESKGISVLEAPVGSEINVDSVIRIERERPPPRPQPQQSQTPMQNITEEPTAPPKPFGPPSTLDEEINIDSIIRINQEQRKNQEARIAKLHQQQSQREQVSALQQWQQKVKAAEEYSVASQHHQSAELGQVTPVWDGDNSNSSINNSPGKKKKKGIFGKLFGGKGRSSAAVS